MKRFSQVTLNDLPVLPLMLENESFLAEIFGGKNVGTPNWLHEQFQSGVQPDALYDLFAA